MWITIQNYLIASSMPVSIELSTRSGAAPVFMKRTSVDTFSARAIASIAVASQRCATQFGRAAPVAERIGSACRQLGTWMLRMHICWSGGLVHSQVVDRSSRSAVRRRALLRQARRRPVELRTSHWLGQRALGAEPRVCCGPGWPDARHARCRCPMDWPVRALRYCRARAVGRHDIHPHSGPWWERGRWIQVGLRFCAMWDGGRWPCRGPGPQVRTWVAGAHLALARCAPHWPA